MDNKNKNHPGYKHLSQLAEERPHDGHGHFIPLPDPQPTPSQSRAIALYWYGRIRQSSASPAHFPMIFPNSYQIPL